MLNATGYAGARKIKSAATTDAQSIANHSSRGVGAVVMAGEDCATNVGAVVAWKPSVIVRVNLSVSLNWWTRCKVGIPKVHRQARHKVLSQVCVCGPHSSIQHHGAHGGVLVDAGSPSWRPEGVPNCRCSDQVEAVEAICWAGNVHRTVGTLGGDAGRCHSVRLADSFTMDHFHMDQDCPDHIIICEGAIGICGARWARKETATKKQ
jgi:hypothetical protein